MTKIALITGASRGIGRATAELAAAQGFDVCVNFTSDEQAAGEVRDACLRQGVRATTFRADVADARQVAAMFAHCDRELGPVSLLVNNAGVIGRATRLADLTDEVLRTTFEINVYGAIHCAREAIRRMSVKSGGSGGAIVNLSSIAAVLGSPNEYVHYAASKGAIETLTVGLAKELGPEGIRVNAVRAGTTDTTIHARSGNPGRPAMVAKAAPLGRVATPRDIAEAVMWFASDGASYTTGAILPVSGGL
jgi:NAD(P)-dependent dehydrogenase (short-subunit alcohol dehydrogenase family)